MIPQDHPEWSDIGRSSRFPPGAALILSLIVSLVLIFMLIASAISDRV